jgi:hypothetical protein
VPSDSNQKNKVAQAVRELKLHVSAADIVAKTGFSLDGVTAALNQLASETLATLEVSRTGEICYRFPPSFAYSHLTHGLQRFAQKSASELFSKAYAVFKFSFGISLFVSMVAVSLLMMIFYSISSVFFGTFESLAEMWQDYFRFFSTIGSRIVSSAGGTPLETGKAAFFKLAEACWSLLFGEPNPNTEIEDERWRLIAQMIRLNEGVILPEHLGSYMSNPANDYRGYFRVLAKFAGYPVVSETNNILFYFPSLCDRNPHQTYALMPEHLLENQWPFSKISRDHARVVLLVAAFNLFGSFFFCLFFLMAARSHSGHALFFFFLALYSSLFFVVPAIRYLVLKMINKSIAKRNVRVLESEAILGNPSPDTLKKLKEAENMRKANASTSANGIIYTTSDNYLDQMTTDEWLKGQS